jgi:general secretion pathway protein D
VYNVQNAKAADLAIVLNELYGGGNGGAGGGPGAPQRGQPGFAGGAAGGIRGLGGAGGGAAGGAIGAGAGGRLGGGGGAGGAGLGRSQQLGSGGGLGSSGGLGGSGGAGGLGGSSRSLGGSSSTGRGGAQSAGALAGARGGQTGGGAGGFVISGGEGPLSMFKNEVRIVADEIANAIVILATKRDYEQILKVLRDLDVVPRQVVIEVLIAEVSLNKQMQLGLQSTLTNPGALGNVPTPVPTTTTGPTASGAAGSSLLNSTLADAGTEALKRLINVASPNGTLTAIITDNSSFKITLTALAQANRLKVLASPHILTADNREASIHVGTEIPILSSQANIAGIAGANGQTALVNNVQYRSTGVILTVLPQVNADGLVNLQVRQEVSEVDDSFSSSTGSPAFTTRTAETTAVVQNGDSLLIGGIIQETTSRGRAGVPYLMDLPVLGRLFRSDNDQVRRVELILLLTPHVIRNRSESLLVTEQYKDRLWDVVDEIERTSGLKPPSQSEMNYIRHTRSRTTEVQRPVQGMLPNRESDD